MSDRDIDKIEGSIGACFNREPFFIDKAKVIRCGDIEQVASEFELSKSDGNCLAMASSEVRSSLTGTSFMLDDSTKRGSIGVVPISRDYIVVFLKPEMTGEKERFRKFEIDGYYLYELRRAILNFIRSTLPNIQLDDPEDWTDEAVAIAMGIAVQPYKKIIKAMRLVFFVLLIEIIIATLFVFWRFLI